jgi:hypothetical protein
MHWECTERVTEEDGFYRHYGACEEISLQRIADSLRNAPKAPLSAAELRLYNATEGASVWCKLIEEYTSRNMTYQSDKLPALSGVISALEKLTGDTCLAGIWKSWFLQGLLWRTQDPDRDLYVFFPKKPGRAEPWRAPSWSFASVEGVILYDSINDYPVGETCAELQECRVVAKGKNPLGELESGFARIKGPVTSVVDVAPQQSSSGRSCMIHTASHGLTEGSVYFDVDPYEDCDVLMTTPHTGIAILPVDSTNNTYTRVGAVRVHKCFQNDSLNQLVEPQYPEPTVVTLL